MKAGVCRSYPFTWYPTIGVGRFDFGRERGVVIRWLGFCAYFAVHVTSEEK